MESTLRTLAQQWNKQFSYGIKQQISQNFENLQLHLHSFTLGKVRTECKAVLPATFRYSVEILRQVTIAKLNSAVDILDRRNLYINFSGSDKWTGGYDLILQTVSYGCSHSQQKHSNAHSCTLKTCTVKCSYWYQCMSTLLRIITTALEDMGPTEAMHTCFQHAMHVKTFRLLQRLLVSCIITSTKATQIIPSIASVNYKFHTVPRRKLRELLKAACAPNSQPTTEVYIDNVKT